MRNTHAWQQGRDQLFNKMLMARHLSLALDHQVQQEFSRSGSRLPTKGAASPKEVCMI